MTKYEELMQRLNKSTNTNTTNEVHVGDDTYKVNTTFASVVRGTASLWESISQQVRCVPALIEAGRESVREDVAAQLIDIIDRK